jgi:hypothetical protein
MMKIQTTKNNFFKMSIFLITLLSSMQSCKVPSPTSGSKATENSDSIKLSIRVFWNTDGSQTTFSVTDKKEKKLTAVPIRVATIKKDGALKPKKISGWTPLHTDGEKDFPVYTAQIRVKNTNNKTMWCQTPSPVRYYQEGELLCLKPDSPKNSFALLCLKSKGQVSYSSKELSCNYQIDDKSKRQKLIFASKKKSGENINNLSDFIQLSKICSFKTNTDIAKLNTTQSNLCQCTDVDKNKSISYNLWHVSAYFREIKKIESQQTLVTNFKSMCINQNALPYPPVEEKIKPVKTTKMLPRDAQINMEICERLQKLKGAWDYDSASQSCLCVDHRSTSASDKGGHRKVSILDIKPIEFVRQCVDTLQLTAATDFKICNRIDMAQYAAPNSTVNPLNPLVCQRIFNIPSFRKQCTYTRGEPLDKFYFDCISPALLLEPK